MVEQFRWSLVFVSVKAAKLIRTINLEQNRRKRWKANNRTALNCPNKLKMTKHSTTTKLSLSLPLPTDKKNSILTNAYTYLIFESVYRRATQKGLLFGLQARNKQNDIHSSRSIL